ncbi:hypothetical protein Tco_1138400 [Tanacetum coccineum]
MEESLSKFMNELAKRHEENSNMIKEIRAFMDAAIRNQGASIKTLEIQIGQMSKVLQERRFGCLPSSTKTNTRDHVKSISTADLTPIHHIGSTRYAVLGPQNSTLLNDSLPQKEKDPGSFIILDMPKDINVSLILGRPFLSTAHIKVDVFKRKITLKVGDEKIVFKPRLMGETLILNRSFDPLYGDYIELNDLNEPLELRRNRVDDLEPTVEEGEVVNEPVMDIVKTRCDFISGLDYYPSNCDFDRRIHIDCAYNLKFSCMMGFECVHANFLPILPINVMSTIFYNSIMKDKIEFKGRNKLGNFVNAPVFIGNFHVITDFTVVEDMDPYLDEGMGDVIVGDFFCKALCVEAKRFDEIITIRDGDDSVTCRMIR